MTRTDRPISPSSITLDGEKRYILAPRGLAVRAIRWWRAERATRRSRKGNTLPLKLIPLGTFVHNVEMKPGKGGQMARSAGSYAQVVAKEGDYGHLEAAFGRGEADYTSPARRPSARSATSTTRTWTGARRAGRAGAACRPDGARHRHEPGRPSAGRRRRDGPRAAGIPALPGDSLPRA